MKSITAKLRRTVVEVLMENDDHPKHQEHINSFDLESVALRSLIIEFLIVNDMVNTQIVFAIESGLNGNMLSREDVIKLFDIYYDPVANKFLRKNKEKMQRKCREKITPSDEKEEQLDKSFKHREKELEFFRFEEIQPKLQEI